jgi:hypothetical protein
MMAALNTNSVSKVKVVDKLLYLFYQEGGNPDSKQDVRYKFKDLKAINPGSSHVSVKLLDYKLPNTCIIGNKEVKSPPYICMTINKTAGFNIPTVIFVLSDSVIYFSHFLN